MQEQQTPLNIDDIVSIGFRDGRPIVAVLRDVFGNQALVAERNQPDRLMLVHRDNIARIEIDRVLN